MLCSVYVNEEDDSNAIKDDILWPLQWKILRNQEGWNGWGTQLWDINPDERDDFGQSLGSMDSGGSVHFGDKSIGRIGDSSIDQMTPQRTSKNQHSPRRILPTVELPAKKKRNKVTEESRMNFHQG